MKSLALWEIMRDGNHGDIFEVIDCCEEEYLGLKIKVKERTDVKGVYKALYYPPDKPQYKHGNTLVTLTGSLGTASYRKIEKYQPILLEEALGMVMDDEKVYRKSDNGSFNEIHKYTELEHLDILDLDDLFKTSFYKRVV